MMIRLKTENLQSPKYYLSNEGSHDIVFSDFTKLKIFRFGQFSAKLAILHFLSDLFQKWRKIKKIVFLCSKHRYETFEGVAKISAQKTGNCSHPIFRENRQKTRKQQKNAKKGGKSSQGSRPLKFLKKFRRSIYAKRIQDLHVLSDLTTFMFFGTPYNQGPVRWYAANLTFC